MQEQTDSRKRLILAAFDLMHTCGYNAAGVSEICRQAGVNKGSFYYFFPSKRDLALAVIDHYHETYVRTLLDSAFIATLPPLQRMTHFFELMCDRVQQAKLANDAPIRGCLLGNFATEMSIQDPLIREKLQIVFQEWIDYFAEAIQDAIDNGDLSDVDPMSSARAILAYYEGISVLAKTYDDPKLVRQLSTNVLTLIQ